ncbi:MAG: Asp-tRNA(Asn)/Glu-tRNA(Gln) amidotransferase subunit GatC [bacterium]|nr:Asp-tRNA(Asn)/Glu-tRNA(Gln) amidotransferase subunit GatC [bacterium]
MISSDDIKHLAALARIDITPVETESLRADLDRILEYVSELSAVPTDEVEPFAGGSLNRSAGSRSSRDDQSRETALPVADARSAFPASRDGYCEVPEVFSN